MTLVDREQVRRDAELMLRAHEPGCECDFHAMPKLAGWITTLASHSLALLDALEQAEREREANLRAYDLARKGQVELREQLAKVPALVEAGREYRKWRNLADSYPGHEEHDEAEWVEIQAQLDEAQESFDEALATFEESQP